MKNILRVGALIITLLIVGCTTEDIGTFNVDISDDDLTGVVYGESFTAIGGKAFDSGDSVSVNITNEVTECSGTIFDYNLYVSVSFILQLGSYQGLNVAFHKEGETPLNFFNGVLEVLSFTDDSITFKMKSGSGTVNSVEGVFTVDYCK